MLYKRISAILFGSVATGQTLAQRPWRTISEQKFEDAMESSRSRTNTSSVSEMLMSSVRSPPTYRTINILSFEFNSANPKSEDGDHAFLPKDKPHALARDLSTPTSSVGALSVRINARDAFCFATKRTILSISSFESFSDFIDRSEP